MKCTSTAAFVARFNMVGESDKAIRNAFKDMDVNERIATLTTTLQKFGGVAEEVGKGITAQWQDVKTRLDDVFEAIGEVLAPVIGDLLKVLSEDILPAIQHLAEAFNELPEPVKEFAVTAALAVAALAPLAAGLAAFGLAATALEGVLPALTGMLEAVGVETSGLGAAALAAAPAILAIGTALAALHFSEVDEAALKFGETLVHSFGGLVDLITPGREAIEALKAALGPVGAVLEVIDAAFEKLKSSGISFRDVLDFIIPALKYVREGLTDAAVALEYLSGNYKSMGDASKLVMQNLEDHNREFVNSLRDSTEEQRKGIDIVRAHTLSKKELAEATKAAAAAEQLFIDQIGKVQAFIGPLTEDQLLLNQYLNEGATAIEHVRTAADDLMDSQLGEYYESIAATVETSNEDLQLMAQYTDDAAHSVVNLRDAAADLADSQLAEFYEGISDELVNNVIPETHDYSVAVTGVGDSWEQTGHRVKTTAQDLSNVISRDLAGTLKDLLFHIDNVGKDFMKLGADIVDTVLNHIIKLALKPLMDNLDQILAKIPGLGGLAGGLGGGGSKSSSGGGGGGGAAGGGLSSALGIAGLGVDIAAGITQGIQMAHLNNLMGEVEVSTRGALNQLISIQGTLNTYLPNELHLVDIWAEIIVTNDILRLMAQNGGGLSGGGGAGSTTTDNGLDPDFAQKVADAINANPSNAGDNSLATSMNDYSAALQTTASTAYRLDEAASGVTDSLSRLNDATKEIHGALPEQYKEPAGAAAGPLPFATPNQFMQGAMLPNVNNPIQYGSIAPVVGTQGFTRGPNQGGTVNIYAVDPNGRDLARSTQKGLEEIGIRVR